MTSASAPAARTVSNAAVTKDWVPPSFFGMPDIIMIFMIAPPFEIAPQFCLLLL